jgi:hypothetical protein
VSNYHYIRTWKKRHLCLRNERYLIFMIISTRTSYSTNFVSIWRNSGKDDHSNADVIASHRLHLRSVFVKARLINKTIIKSTVIYALMFWHASHDRSNSVVDTTTKLVKMHQQCLKMISDSFITMSTQILEIEIFIKLIQLHLIHLQIKFRQRMKKKQHDVLILNFCNKI